MLAKDDPKTVNRIVVTSSRGGLKQSVTISTVGIIRKISLGVGLGEMLNELKGEVEEVMTS